MPGQRQDYILRQLDILRRIVASLVGRREPPGIEDALQMSFDLQEKLFALPAADFLRLEVSEQVAALGRHESPAAGREKILMYAGLLQETARVYEFRDQADLAAGARQLALHVVLHLALEEPADLEAAASVRELVASLDPTQLYPPVRAMLDEYAQGTK